MVVPYRRKNEKQAWVKLRMLEWWLLCQNANKIGFQADEWMKWNKTGKQSSRESKQPFLGGFYVGGLGGDTPFKTIYI